MVAPAGAGSSILDAFRPPAGRSPRWPRHNRESSRSARRPTPISSWTWSPAPTPGRRSCGRLAARATNDDRRRQPGRRLPARAVGLDRAGCRATGRRPASTSRWWAPAGYVLPATQHDIVVWLTGSGYDVVFDLSRTVIVGLAGAAELANEIVGWPYHHDLDLTGFIDGTENPTLVEASSVAIIPAGSPGEGGSILLLQQWEHDAVGWERLSGRRPGGDHRPPQGGQRGAGSAATRVARRADRPGAAGQDLPPQHRLRHARPARDDLRGLQPRTSGSCARCSRR